MKKTLLVFILCLATALCFTGCDWFKKDCEHTYDNACDITCNECGEERTVTHDYTAADCDTPKTCKVCGATEGKALGHSWSDGSCENAISCSVCGEIAGKPFGHRWSDPDPTLCSSKRSCFICGATEGEDKAHSYDNDCDTSCNACGKDREISHDWCAEACGLERYCSVCGHSDGEIMTHDWLAATCTNPKTCDNCGETEGEALHHECTDVRYNAEGHWYACPNCNEGDDDSFEKHSGLEPNCSERGYCLTCSQTYGSVIPDAHDFSTLYVWAENYVSVEAYAECIYCGEEHSESAETKFEAGVATVEFKNDLFEDKLLRNVISAVDLSADELKALVAQALAAGEREIYVDLKADAPASFVTAIRAAILESDAEDGSVSLTLTGIETIPDDHTTVTTESGEVMIDEIAFSALPELLSVKLPDAKYIGEQAFQNCKNLSTMYAPKAEQVCRLAFMGTAITEVNLPLAKEIGESAFLNLDLVAVSIPSATYIGLTAFANLKDDAKGYTLYLNAKGNITIEKTAFFTGQTTPALTKQIKLILNSDKYNKVNGNTWAGFSWKSIRLICSDGSFDHSITDCVYTFSDDYSYCEAEGACHKCGMKVYEKVTTGYSDGVLTADFKTSGFESQTKSMILGTQLTPEELQEDVGLLLGLGIRNLLIYLPADAPAEMITAIRRAICDTEGVADGSVNLTLEGVTTIPDDEEWECIAFGYGDVYDEVSGSSYTEYVTQLASVNLPDVTYIGSHAFYYCEYLTSVTAPKVQTIGQDAFSYTALTSVEFPELTTIPYGLFSGTWTLTSAKFPKVTTIENAGLLIGWQFAPDENPTPFPLELTAEGDITFNGSYHFNIDSQNYSGKVDLVLHSNKVGEVDGLTWNGYTFRSIEFLCTDGTTNHSYGEAVEVEYGTHKMTCSVCKIAKFEKCHGEEPTCQELGTCAFCGKTYGEFSDHIIDPATGYCKFGCGEWMATFAIEQSDTLTYHLNLSGFQNQTLADGSVVTLLADGSMFGWGVVGDYTLDLNAYTLTNERYSLYVGYAVGGHEISLVNNGNERSAIPFIRMNNATLKVGSKVDVAAMILFYNTCTVDLTNADFVSCKLTLNLDGCNTSQFVLGNYAIYDAYGNVVTGALSNGQLYIIKAAE